MRRNILILLRKGPGILELGHAAVDEVQIAVFFIRHWVHVFHLPDGVSGQPAILPADAVTAGRRPEEAAKIRTNVIVPHFVPGFKEIRKK